MADHTNDVSITDDLETVRKLVHYHCGDDCHEDRRGHDKSGSIPCAYEAFQRINARLTSQLAQNDAVKGYRP